MPLETNDGFSVLPMATPGLVSERAPPTPWHDDYEMAPSVGPVFDSTLLFLFFPQFTWILS